MTIRETCFPLFFYLALVIHPADRHFERSEKSFSSLFSMTPSLCRLREAPPPTFSRYGVSRFSLSDTRPLAANEKDPSAPLGMTIREHRFSHVSFHPAEGANLRPFLWKEGENRALASPLRILCGASDFYAPHHHFAFLISNFSFLIRA